MEEAVAVGLSHLSSGIGARLTTLAISAQAANLPRISLALKALADEVRALQEREAQADESRLFLSLVRCWTLADATRRAGDTADPGLVGVSRSQYVDVPEMELCGVGAYPWQTRSGYRGLTLLFWSNKTREFLSWSEARPRTQQFDPRQRFFADGPWDGAQSPRQVASSNILLRGARRTAAGRISGSSRTTVLVPGPTSLAQLDFGDRCFTSWPALDARALAVQPIGLRDSNPLDRVAVIEPAFAGGKRFESVTQTLVWEVFDEEENVLQLSLPFEELSKETVRTLEALNPPAGSRWKILVHLNLGDERLIAMPISILDPGKAGSPVFHLAFDAEPKRVSKYHARAPEEQQEEDASSATDEGADDEELQASSAYLRGFLGELERRLVAAAEAGTATGIAENARRFSEMRIDAHGAGLTMLAAALGNLVDGDSDGARCLIQARYLAHLHASAGARMI
jgi:hypothetical protein